MVVFLLKRVMKSRLMWLKERVRRGYAFTNAANRFLFPARFSVAALRAEVMSELMQVAGRRKYIYEGYHRG